MSKLTVRGLKGVRQLAHVEYDFAKDAGAVGDVALFTLKAGTIVHNCWAEVETAMASGGAATIDLGDSGDPDGLLTQAAFSAYAADFVSGDAELGADLASGARKKYAAEATINMAIGTAALTAGKVHFYLEVSDGR